MVRARSAVSRFLAAAADVGGAAAVFSDAALTAVTQPSSAPHKAFAQGFGAVTATAAGRAATAAEAGMIAASVPIATAVTRRRVGRLERRCEVARGWVTAKDATCLSTGPGSRPDFFCPA